MQRWRSRAILAVLVLTVVGISGERSSAQAPPTPAFGQNNLVLYGDIAVFWGGGNPENCALRSRFKRGEPVGFRIYVEDPLTGTRVESAKPVIHLNYAGQTLDLPMRYRATATQPERQFWVVKWIVPADAPTGMVRYTATATDDKGRSGEYKPFNVDTSQLTIVAE